jgi:hypothetical protein
MIEVKNVGNPDEQRDFLHGRLDLFHLTGLAFGVGTFEPGWRWSESMRPLFGTELCEVHHNGYVVQGRMRFRMRDGSEHEVGPGDVFVCPSGHDAWVVGDEPCVALDFSGGAHEYARAKAGGSP